MKLSRALWACALALASISPRLAHAQSTPDENSLFGGNAPADAGAPPAADGGTAPTGPDESAVFGGSNTAPPSPQQPATQAAPKGENDERQSDEQLLSSDMSKQSSSNVAPDNPLSVGGTLYLRSQVSAYKDTPAKDWGFSMPNLLDVYFDGRPNDRVRAFAVGRVSYDPTIDPTVVTSNGAKRDQAKVFLDQLWLNFDVSRRAFVTVGKQHVKWGTGRFWNPTDYLQPVRLDPLAVFDERTGVTMLKVHVPWEAQGWNFYGFGVFEGTQAVNTVQRVGGAGRAEIVLGPAELGLDFAAQHGRKPRFGIDLSSGLGPIPVDAHVEVALHGLDTPLPRFRPGLDLRTLDFTQTPDKIANQALDSQVPTGVYPQVVAGADYQVNLNDRDALTLGGEYFYNAAGTDDTSAFLYEALVVSGRFNPFYLGKHYGGLFAVVSLPRGQVVNNFVLTTLGNFSDTSFITRLDYSITVLTHLRVEFYGDVHYGHEGGEFRFGINSGQIPAGTGEVPTVLVPTPLFDAGLALRVSI